MAASFLMPVPAAGTVHVLAVLMVMPVLVRVAVGVAVRMVVIVVIVRVAVPMGMPVVMVVLMPVVMLMPMIVSAGAVIVGLPLRAEGARDRGGGAALAPDQLGIGRRVGHVEDVRPDLGRHVVAAELPGEAREAGRVLGPDLQQGFGRGAHGHEPSVLQPQGVAVLDRRGLRESEIEGQPALRMKMAARPAAGGMVEDHRIDDGIRPNGGLAHQGRGSLHGVLEDGLDGLGPSVRRRGNLHVGTRGTKRNRTGGTEPWPCGSRSRFITAKLVPHHRRGGRPDRTRETP